MRILLYLLRRGSRMIKNLICINCPRGCRLTIDTDTMTVKGNSCIKGLEYGLNEVTNPVRIITTTVKIINGEQRLLPVKTEKAIPKDMNFKCMKILNGLVIKAPIKVGDIIIKNILDTGVDVIACRNID
jgi:CxxC motif-containing protein